MLKVRFNDGTLISFHKGLIVKKDSLYSYLDYLTFQLSLKSDDYKDENEYSHIIFDYFEISKEREKYFEESRWIELKNKSIEIKKFKTFYFNNHKLPLNMNYLSWGEIHLDLDDLKVITFNDQVLIITKKSETHFEIKVSSSQNKDLKFTFEDRIALKDHFFIREVDKTVFYCDILNEKIVLMTKTIKTNFLSKLKMKPISKPKIITIDIETKVTNGVHKAYLFSMYDGKDTFSWFSENAIELLQHLLQRKYEGYDVYAHNLSNFDIIFLLKDISKFRKEFKINFLKKEDKFIAIHIYNHAHHISITLKDSLLLLPSSLDKLSSQFQIENPKEMEPVYQGDPLNTYYMADLSHYSKEVEILKDFSEWEIFHSMVL